MDHHVTFARLGTKILEGAPRQMAQGNVISAPWCNPLHLFLFPCSISLSPVTAPSIAVPRIRPTMNSAEGTRTEFGRSSIGIDGRRPEGRSRSL